MLKPAQVQKILETRSKKEEPEPPQTMNHIQYVLEGIIFTNPQNWTLWVNNIIYTHNQNTLQPGIIIMAKDHESAEIQQDGQRHIIFPGQSFLPEKSQVIRTVENLSEHPSK